MDRTSEQGYWEKKARRWVDAGKDESVISQDYEFQENDRALLAHTQARVESLRAALKGSEEARLAGEQKIASLQAEVESLRKKIKILEQWRWDTA